MGLSLRPAGKEKLGLIVDTVPDSVAPGPAGLALSAAFGTAACDCSSRDPAAAVQAVTGRSLFLDIQRK